MLDIESFTYLNRALESTISPHVILATNRGLATIRGTEFEPSGEGIVSPHGLPIDLLDRCMIVRTIPYNREEIKRVLALRARVEGLTVSPEAAEKLADEGVRTSLRYVCPVLVRMWPHHADCGRGGNRYALQLLTPSSILSKISGQTELGLQDVSEIGSLFLDARSSARTLAKGTSNGTDGRSEYLG
jgi:RuvB-like protein 1 (pontin 52)